MIMNTLKVEPAHALALKKAIRTAIKNMADSLDISDLLDLEIEIGEFISKKLELEVEDRL
jgi:hypothetical protein